MLYNLLEQQALKLGQMQVFVCCQLALPKICLKFLVNKINDVSCTAPI